MISLVHTLLPASHATPGRLFTRKTTSTFCVPTPSATTSTRPVYQPAVVSPVVSYVTVTLFVASFTFPAGGFTLNHAVGLLVAVTVYDIVPCGAAPVFATWN